MVLIVTKPPRFSFPSSSIYNLRIVTCTFNAVTSSSTDCIIGCCYHVSMAFLHTSWKNTKVRGAWDSPLTPSQKTLTVLPPWVTSAS